MKIISVQKRMQWLTNCHKIIANLIGSEQFHYIDVPMYMNIGDHLIAHGTFKFFEKSNLNFCRASGLPFYKFRWINNVNVLVFGGGGNFGDLWPEIHQRRMQLIDEALELGKRVIVLPQSLWYSNIENLKLDLSILQGRENFYLFVRDKQSYQIGKNIHENVYLVPDMAHHIYNELEQASSDVKPNKDVLYFLRNDKEGVISRNEFEKKGRIWDWDDVLKIDNCGRDFQRVLKIYNLFYRKLNISNFDRKLFLWRKSSWKIVMEAAKLFASHKLIVTDRLHGLIFASMLNRSFSIRDNLYNKISNYENAWLK